MAYCAKFERYNNIVYVDFPKTPEGFVNKSRVFCASNGIRITSCDHADIEELSYRSKEITIYVRGISDNNKTTTVVAQFRDEKQATEALKRLQSAFLEFSKWLETPKINPEVAKALEIISVYCEEHECDVCPLNDKKNLNFSGCLLCKVAPKNYRGVFFKNKEE